MHGYSPYGLAVPSLSLSKDSDPSAGRGARVLHLPDGQLPPGPRTRARICVPTGGRAVRRLVLREQQVLLLWARAEHHAELWVAPWGGSTRVGSGEEWAALRVQSPDPASLYRTTVVTVSSFFFLSLRHRL